MRAALLSLPFMGEAGWLSPLSPLNVDPWKGELVACSSGERPVVSTRLRGKGRIRVLVFHMCIFYT